MVLISGIEEAKILEIKKEEIHQKTSQSIKANGWLPNLFRSIMIRAKDFLQNLIREQSMPPKPTLDIDMAGFRHMRNLMIKLQDKAKEIPRQKKITLTPNTTPQGRTLALRDYIYP